MRVLEPSIPIRPPFLADFDSLLDRCNKWLLTDLAAGAVLAEAVVRLCDYNVRINAPNCEDAQTGRELLESSDLDCRRAREISDRIEEGVKAQIAP